MKQQIQLSDHFNYSRLLRLSLPPIIMMIFTSIYSVVDGFFVSNFAGKTPFAALNLIYPFVAILGGVGFMMGSGGSALVGKTLGEGNKEQANEYFSMTVEITVVAGILLSLVGFLFIEPIAVFLGADETMLPDCVVYGRILLGFNTLFMLQGLFHTFLSTAQKPKLGLIATVCAGVVNMVLDALFVAVFKWGVAGAAIATGLSQTVGGLLPLIYFIRPNTSLLRFKLTKLKVKPLVQAATNGLSEMVSNVSGSIVAMLFNFQLIRLAGENGVSAYGVLMYVGFIFVAIFIGYTIATAPVVSYHYGAQNWSEVKNIMRRSLKLMLLVGAAMTALCFVLAPVMSSIFVGYDPELYAMTIRAFRFYAFGFLLAGINFYTSSFFTALNNGLISGVVSLVRGLLLQALWVLVLPVFFELDGIWITTIATEVSACVVCVIFLLANRKRYHYGRE